MLSTVDLISSNVLGLVSFNISIWKTIKSPIGDTLREKGDEGWMGDFKNILINTYML